MKLGCLSLVLTLVTVPLWYYVLYSVLAATHQDRLVWFMFWVYLPFNFLVHVIGFVIAAEKEKR